MSLKKAFHLQAFDKITYCKGASVLFMLHEFIGPDVFKDAIQEYMEHFCYDNATTEDLWHFLSSSSKQDVGTIMNAWIRYVSMQIFYEKQSEIISYVQRPWFPRCQSLHLRPPQY